MDISPFQVSKFLSKFFDSVQLNVFCCIIVVLFSLRKLSFTILFNLLELNQLLLIVMNKIHSLNRVMGFARKHFVAL